jgi:hypothetical protein
MRLSSSTQPTSAYLRLTKWATSELSPEGRKIYQGDIKAGMCKGRTRRTSSRNVFASDYLLRALPHLSSSYLCSVLREG